MQVKNSFNFSLNFALFYVKFGLFDKFSIFLNILSFVRERVFVSSNFQFNNFIFMFGTNSICYQRPKAGYET